MEHGTWNEGKKAMKRRKTKKKRWNNLVGYARITMDRSEDLRGKPRDRYEARTLSSQSCKARQGKKARWAAGSTIRWLASLVPKVSRAVSRAAKDDGSCTAMRVTEGSQKIREEAQGRNDQSRRVASGHDNGNGRQHEEADMV